MPPADLEARYRCYLADQHEWLSFPGLSRSGRPISLPLERVYVELKAVADVPEAADTFSADERRLLVEDEARGGRGGADLRMTLDSLRAERWRRDDRAGRGRFQRRSIDEAMADPVARGLVILGAGTTRPGLSCRPERPDPG